MELERSQESFDIPQPSPRYPISYNALTTAFKEAHKQHQSKATKAFDFLNDNLSKILEINSKLVGEIDYNPVTRKAIALSL
jgi:hypothetical protein